MQPKDFLVLVECYLKRTESPEKLSTINKSVFRPGAKVFAIESFPPIFPQRCTSQRHQFYSPYCARPAFRTDEIEPWNQEMMHRSIEDEI